MAAFECDDWHRGQFAAAPLRNDLYVALGVEVEIERLIRVRGNVGAGIRLPEDQAPLLRNPPERFAYICDDDAHRASLQQLFHVGAVKRAGASRRTGRSRPTIRTTEA
jgi:hypothetical protein